MSVSFDPVIFVFGCVGAAAPEIVRVYRAKSYNVAIAPKSALVSLAFFLLGGTAAIALGATTLQAALYDGIAVPVIMTTAASSTASSASQPASVAITLDHSTVDRESTAGKTEQGSESSSVRSNQTSSPKESGVTKGKPTAITTMEYIGLLTWRGAVQAKAGMIDVTRRATEVPGLFMKGVSKSGQPKRVVHKEEKERPDQ